MRLRDLYDAAIDKSSRGCQAVHSPRACNSALELLDELSHTLPECDKIMLEPLHLCIDSMQNLWHVALSRRTLSIPNSGWETPVRKKTRAINWPSVRPSSRQYDKRLLTAVIIPYAFNKTARRMEVQELWSSTICVPQIWNY